MKFSAKEAWQFFRGMFLLLHSGISLTEGIRLLAQEQEPVFQNVLHEMGNCLENGSRLSETLKETGLFSGHVCGMIAIAEETGNLEEILGYLADYYEQHYQLQRQIKSILAYPCRLLLLMVAVIFALLAFVLPVFDQVYASLGISMDGIAGILLVLGNWLRASWLEVLTAALLLAALLAAIMLLPALRQRVVKGYIGFLGDRGIARKFNNARFVQGLSLCFSSGIPMETAFGFAQNMLEDIPGVAQRCSKGAAMLEEGWSLPEVMAAEEFLSPAQSRMLSVGLRSGNADRMLADMSTQLMEDAQEALENRIAGIEPAMVTGASLLVGVILLAVMLPLMELLSAIG